MEQLYADCEREAHAVSDSCGHVSHISTFADNSYKTVYEFFNEIEMSLMGWGTNSQRAHLLHKLPSEEIKTKVDVAENRSKIKAKLIIDYGSADRIVSDILVGLSNKKRPAIGNKKERFQFYNKGCVSS